jgi:quercetin dioxygenase-like cupin family protein
MHRRASFLMVHCVALAIRSTEHASPGPFSLSVREGRVRFEAGEETVEAGPGVLLTCDAGVRHTVEALGDAVCLLSVAVRRSGTEASG